MKPKHIDGKTNTKSWNPRLDPVALPIERKDGMCITYWSCSFWERVKILFGKPVQLWVLDRVQPPVHLEA